MEKSPVLLNFKSSFLLKEVCKRIVIRGKKSSPKAYIDDKTSKVIYNGISVFGKPSLDGGGSEFGQDYSKCLLMLGLKRCESIYEFCAGPAYIGYSLLANGFCEKLTLADIDPKAVEIAKATASYNGIENLVNIYLSDCLDGIPRSEQWDLVVGNPPHCLVTEKTHTNIKIYDQDWRVHRRFYNKIKMFMKKDGYVVLLESCGGSSADIFKPMIKEGGGRFIKTILEQDVSGKKNGFYYIVSQW